MSSTISLCSDIADYRRLSDVEDETPIPEKLRETLKALRGRVPHKKIASILGLDRTTYTKIENGGVKSIKIEYLAKLAEYYKVDLDGLIRGNVASTEPVDDKEFRALKFFRAIRKISEDRADGIIDFLEFNSARVRREDQPQPG